MKRNSKAGLGHGVKKEKNQRSVVGYSQWYLTATEGVARVAWERMMKEQCRLWLYYKPQGLAFAVASEVEGSPLGFELVTGEALPMSMTVEQLGNWVRYRTGSVPVLPGD